MEQPLAATETRRVFNFLGLSERGQQVALEDGLREAADLHFADTVIPCWEDKLTRCGFVHPEISHREGTEVSFICESIDIRKLLAALRMDCAKDFGYVVRLLQDGWEVMGSVTRAQGHYTHENTTRVSVETNYTGLRSAAIEYLLRELELIVTERARAANESICRDLEEAYEETDSVAMIKDRLIQYGTLFYEDGSTAPW